MHRLDTCVTLLDTLLWRAFSLKPLRIKREHSVESVLHHHSPTFTHYPWHNELLPWWPRDSFHCRRASNWRGCDRWSTVSSHPTRSHNNDLLTLVLVVSTLFREWVVLKVLVSSMNTRNLQIRLHLVFSSLLEHKFHSKCDDLEQGLFSNNMDQSTGHIAPLITHGLRDGGFGSDLDQLYTQHCGTASSGNVFLSPLSPSGQHSPVDAAWSPASSSSGDGEFFCLHGQYGRLIVLSSIPWLCERWWFVRMEPFCIVTVVTLAFSNKPVNE